MFRKHQGDSILEWVVLAVLVLVVLGIAAFNLATTTGAGGASVTTWVTGLY